MSDISINKTILNKRYETKIGADIIVPDSKSDVANVINVYATVSIGESYINKDKITISGSICYNIIYKTDEEMQRVCSINYKSPFSHQIDIQNSDTVSSCMVKAYVKKIDFSTLNSRKIGVGVAVLFDVMLNETISEEISVMCDDYLPVKTDKIICFNNAISYKEDFCVEYKTNLNDAENILNCFAKVCSKDVKVINNKVILKGNVKFGVLYENENSQINFNDFSLDFTEVFDVNNISPEMLTNVDIIIKESDINLNYNDDGENLFINAYLCAYINAYEEYEHDIYCDAYSPDYEIEVDKKTLEYQALIKNISDKIIIIDYIDASKNGISTIYDTSVCFEITKETYVNRKILVEGNALVDVLYLSPENEVCAVKKSIPFSYSQDLKNDIELCNVKSEISCENINYNVSISGEIEVKLNISIGITLTSDVKTDFITSIKIDKTKIIDKTNMSSITIYFVQKGDTLWEIAKKYRTTVDKIAQINNLDKNNIIIAGQRLLIPKK